MTSDSKHFYEFANFRLDPFQKVLLHNGKLVHLTPKVFDTLEILVEENGKLLEKEELMQRIWQDRFVEESNLTSNIKTLRKALGDNSAQPTFIETVPRRGYRFIADVNKLDTGQFNDSTAQASHPQVVPSRAGRIAVPLVAVILVLVASIAIGSWYVESNGSADAPILFAPFSSEKLSTDGNVHSAAVSPDGANVVYAKATAKDQSVWLRQLGSSTHIQIIPPSENSYFGFAFSPDSQTLYFARVEQDPEDGQQADVYSIPIPGGVPTKIVSQAQGSISVSPDGEKISFIRCPYLDNEYCSLWIADSDGRNERKVLSRPRPIRIGTMNFSPDGKTIAFAFGQSRNWANEFNLAEVDTETGVERDFTPEKFFNIKRLAWLPNQRGILMTARRNPDNNFRIWHVSAATGEIAALTHDSDDYASLSLSRDGRVLAATKNRADYRLNVYQADPAEPPRVLAEASTVTFAPNGKIVFSSDMTGNREIWSINADGSEQRQLTNDPGWDLFSVVSPDNKFIFFDSNRTGEAQVWRMNADGSDQIQITHKVGGFPHLVSPDGKWLYFMSVPERKLMRIQTDGGEEELVLDKRSDNTAFSVLDKRSYSFALSPDALQAAFFESRDRRTVIAIVSLVTQQTIKTFELPNEKSIVVQSAWSPDGKSLFYISQDDKRKNYIVWQQRLDGGTPVQIADLGVEELRDSEAFSISPNGKSFGVIQGGWKHDAVLIKGLK